MGRGYNGYSKSNNAVTAEAEGRFPATALAKRIGGGATPAGVRAVLTSSEWHHSSKKYNRVDYYDLPGAAEEMAEEEGISVAEAEARLIAEIREASKRGRSEAAEIKALRVEAERIGAEWTLTPDTREFWVPVFSTLDSTGFPLPADRKIELLKRAISDRNSGDYEAAQVKNDAWVAANAAKYAK